MASLPRSAPVRIGPYVLLGEIAAGGMATVHLGAIAGRWVAVKRLHRHHALDPERAAMFLDEGRIAARVRHPNVVAALDVVAHEDEHLLVMELVRGAPLAAAAGPAPPAVASRVVIDALLGLAAVHEARDEAGAPLAIVHRDVSPQNLLVGVDGVTRLADFGIARAEGRLHLTAPGRTKGKLAYMAPEQLRGEEVTRRADLYGASVVLWEALTGRRLFPGEAASEVYGKVLEGVVRPPSAHVPLAPAIDAVVLRGLARAPSLRHARAEEMAADLGRALPPAGYEEVAAWIAAAAAPALAAQAERLADLTSAAEPSPAPPAHRAIFAEVARRARLAPPPRMAARPEADDDETGTITSPGPGARARSKRPPGRT